MSNIKKCDSHQCQVFYDKCRPLCEYSLYMLLDRLRSKLNALPLRHNPVRRLIHPVFVMPKPFLVEQRDDVVNLSLLIATILKDRKLLKHNVHSSHNHKVGGRAQITKHKLMIIKKNKKRLVFEK